MFLERYKVSTLGAIVPYVLHKAFVRKSRCELRIGTQSYAEDEAEEKLAELLGFSRTERGASKLEHAGIPDLLCVLRSRPTKFAIPAATRSRNCPAATRPAARMR